MLHKATFRLGFILILTIYALGYAVSKTWPRTRPRPDYSAGEDRSLKPLRGEKLFQAIVETRARSGRLRVRLEELVWKPEGSRVYTELGVQKQWRLYELEEAERSLDEADARLVAADTAWTDEYQGTAARQVERARSSLWDAEKDFEQAEAKLK